MQKGEKWSKKYRELMKKIMARRSYKEKISLTSKKMWNNSRIRRRILKGIKKVAKNLEHRKRLRALWTKERRKEQSLRKKRLYENNFEIREMISRKLEERYEAHPYLRERLSREKQEYYEKNPEARNNLLEYWNKPERKIKAKNAIVKSEGERIINDALVDAGIKADYEAVELNFPEIDPIPDFFPSGKCEYGKIENVLIEYYGGHPKSWKRKVEKNKVYKKYNIPVLIITPSELKIFNFKDYLLKELVKLSSSKIARAFDLRRWQLKRK